MNNCHQSKSEQDLNAHLSSDHAKRILRAIAVRLNSLLSDIWNSVSIPALNEPRIWQRRDRFGQAYWKCTIRFAIALSDAILRKNCGAIRW